MILLIMERSGEKFLSRTANFKMFSPQIHRLLKLALIVVMLGATFISVSFHYLSDFSEITDASFSKQQFYKLSNSNSHSIRNSSEALTLGGLVNGWRMEASPSSSHTNHNCVDGMFCSYCPTGASCSASAISTSPIQLLIPRFVFFQRHFVHSEYISQTLSPIKHPPRLS